MARRDFLNWCEEHLSEVQRPRLFASREAALHFVESNRASKSFEISESSKPAQEGESQHDSLWRKGSEL